MAADTHPAPSLPRPPHCWPSGCCSLVPRPRRRVFRAAGSSKSAGDCPTVVQRPAALSVLPPCCSRAAFPASPAPCALGYPLPCPALHRLQPRLRAGCPQEPLQCLLNSLEIRSPAITVLGSPGEPFALDTLPAWQQPAAVSPALRCGSSHEHFTSAFPGQKGHAANASGSMEANIARKA